MIGRWWIGPSRLRRLGVLGMNRRNVRYIAPYNDPAHHALVNNKLLTKQAVLRAGIATPCLWGSVDGLPRITETLQQLHSLSEFVIKPANGSQGRGIIVVTNHPRDGFVRSNGEHLSTLDIHRHLRDIINGRYSLGGQPDAAMIEERVHFTPLFEAYSYRGVPDVRVVVFQGVPVMSMLRCATQRSRGRANLHQGAVAVGLDMESGLSIRAVQRDRAIGHHPDTGRSFAGLRVPGWKGVLELAARCCDVAGMGYLGCDIVLDRRERPMILELNARPGLSVQVANAAGLRARLETVEKLGDAPGHWSVQERVAFSRDRFGGSAPELA